MKIKKIKMMGDNTAQSSENKKSFQSNLDRINVNTRSIKLSDIYEGNQLKNKEAAKSGG